MKTKKIIWIVVLVPIVSLFILFFKRISFYAQIMLNLSVENYTGAIEQADKALIVYPDSAFFYATRWSIKYELKNYIGAIEDYDKSILLDPTDPEYFISRSVARWKLWDTVWEAEDIKKYEELSK